MKTFMAVYMGSNSDEAFQKWEAMDAKAKQALEEEGKKAWGAWVMKNINSIVDHGAPLGKTKSVSTKGIADMTNRLAAYTVVKAESHEEAAKLFLDHPHFKIFPGDSVEIMECLPMPKA